MSYKDRVEHSVELMQHGGTIYIKIDKDIYYVDWALIDLYQLPNLDEVDMSIEDGETLIESSTRLPDEMGVIVYDKIIEILCKHIQLYSSNLPRFIKNRDKLKKRLSDESE